jgi:hypothetical protein
VPSCLPAIFGRCFSPGFSIGYVRIFTVVNKPAKWTILMLLLSFLYFLATAFYTSSLTLNHIFGIPLTGRNAAIIFEKIYQWHTDLSGYELDCGEFAVTGSPCKTEFFHFKNRNDKDRKEVLIIAYLAELAYYSSKNLEILRNPIERTFAKTSSTNTLTGIKRITLYPIAVFNTRLFPKGEYLRIYGMDTISCRDTTLGAWRAKVIRGSFREIGFEVEPNDGFIKNIPEVIDFGDEKQGAIIFLQDNASNKLLMIQYVDQMDNSEYEQYLDSLLSRIPALSINPLPD